MYARKPEIDIGLDALCRHSQPGQTLPRPAIAEVCGCSSECIREIEKRAIKKLRAIAIDSGAYDYINPSLAERPN